MADTQNATPVPDGNDAYEFILNKFRIGKLIVFFTFGLRDKFTFYFIFLRTAESGEFIWQLGREQLHESRICMYV
jgi:hypothetical protein